MSRLDFPRHIMICLQEANGAEVSLGDITDFCMARGIVSTVGVGNPKSPRQQTSGSITAALGNLRKSHLVEGGAGSDTAKGMWRASARGLMVKLEDLRYSGISWSERCRVAFSRELC